MVPHCRPCRFLVDYSFERGKRVLQVYGESLAATNATLVALNTKDVDRDHLIVPLMSLCEYETPSDESVKANYFHPRDRNGSVAELVHKHRRSECSFRLRYADHTTHLLQTLCESEHLSAMELLERLDLNDRN